MIDIMRLFLFVPILLLLSACAQQAPGWVEPADSALVTEYLTPVRVICSRGDIGNADHLLEPFPGQVYNVEPEGAVFSKGDYVVLDFGKEIQGGLQLVRDSKGSKNVRFRIVFGESVSEALSSVGAPGSTATNDHAVRDFELAVPWMGSIEVGNSGFRFVRVELADDGGKDVSLQAVRAVSKYRDVPYLGSFRCSDERLNKSGKRAPIPSTCACRNTSGTASNGTG